MSKKSSVTGINLNNVKCKTTTCDFKQIQYTERIKTVKVDRYEYCL